MLQKEFFEKIELQFEQQLPFVAYRMPNNVSVKAMLQPDIKLHHLVDFADTGFVFAPFNSEKSTILFPFEVCETISSEFSFSNDNAIQTSEELKSEIAIDAHLSLVQKGIDYINNGQIQKVVLSRMEDVSISENNPIAVFDSLLKLYSTAFVYIWYHPKIGLWLGATPETLMRVEGKRFETMSLAGTQNYDASEITEWSTKNKEEQELVTEFIESKIEPFTERFEVSKPQTVRAGQLLHLKTKISGILKEASLKQIINGLHPTPAVCGIPKSEAREFILENEHYDREFYTGYLGELNMQLSQSRNTNKRNVENNAYATVKRTSHLFVNLRCMKIEEGKAFIYVGGGVTRDSKAEEEWEETVNKMQTMLRVLNLKF